MHWCIGALIFSLLLVVVPELLPFHFTPHTWELKLLAFMSKDCNAQAFLKQHISDDELDRSGNSLAQLVDSRGEAFLKEFEVLMNQQAALRIKSHPDWSSLEESDKQFVLNFLSIMIIQNAAAFDRRVLGLVKSFPVVLLSMAKVRHDLPCVKRQALASEFLKRGTCGKLDVDSMKFLRMYQQDIQVAAKSGTCGIKLFMALKAMRRMFAPHVRENERLNKQLSLYGERSPSASLDLISARLTMKYFLGVVGARQEGLFGNKQKKWSTLRPLAGSVFDTCLGHWKEAANVMAPADRFSAPMIPERCPSPQDVKDWNPVLEAGGTHRQQLSVKHVMSAAVNRKLYHFFHDQDSSKKKKKPQGRKSEIQQPCFSVVAFVPGTVPVGRPYTMPAGTSVYAFGEAVNRSVRLLGGVWKSGGKLSLNSPWKFEWVADVIFERIQSNDTSPLTVMVFPMSWVALDDGNLQAELRSKSGQLPFVTVTQWEEASRLNSVLFG